MLTAPQIQKLSKETEDKTKAEVLASADEFSEALTVSADGKDYTYYEGTASGDTIGYVFKTSAKGYGGDIDPVSYTHLDVYKRQVKDSSSRLRERLWQTRPCSCLTRLQAP